MRQTVKEVKGNKRIDQNFESKVRNEWKNEEYNTNNIWSKIGLMSNSLVELNK